MSPEGLGEEEAEIGLCEGPAAGPLVREHQPTWNRPERAPTWLPLTAQTAPIC